MERVLYLRGFRKQHWQLQVMVGPLGNEKRIGLGGEVEKERRIGGEVDMDAEVSLYFVKRLEFWILIDCRFDFVPGSTGLRER